MPTYSGFKYENLMLTNVILAFLIIVLSIQTKLGIKVNILVDRVYELWNGSDSKDKKDNVRSGVRVSQPLSKHSTSQADYLDNSGIQSGMFPPAPVATTKQNSVMDSYDYMMPNRNKNSGDYGLLSGPMAANSLLGGAFGSSF